MKYLMICLTVVNLRYRTVSNPKVQLILRGVEFSEHSQETEYYNYLGNGGIDGLKSLYGIVEFVKKKNKTYGEFDMVYFSTGYVLRNIGQSHQHVRFYIVAPLY
ncbi:uncharacterized protein LOC125939836 [Dermacentor silvarum]|uniref:uncharacterized protein LOC125939836 n=1 Tax=Dermacentor silvarum TaxID=543639 RepID=UPI0021012590|nr:uncharacterized protein LOC125939836 [Dermacentor silvarum]